LTGLKPYNEVLKWCWANDIYVVICPTVKGYSKKPVPVTLEIHLGKTIKQGKQIYEQNSRELVDKIEEIYRHYYLS
jgi:hypothetical protein